MAAMCVRMSSDRSVLHFTPINAASCVLPRPASRNHNLVCNNVSGLMFFINEKENTLNLWLRHSFDDESTALVAKMQKQSDTLHPHLSRGQTGTVG
ncbi:hypothetical protein DERP_010107 [Dermatophagoides pteronyssinus]|uniref:Uncharacterized protein n=1 Tax=Dermatophagoides pteronyssinus TaxID=6956 RepID=A0ABQ8JFQ1_DERPT|nr:hypothetical protein DERP_010107 [Dermatophagoides pteronyssinus]